MSVFTCGFSSQLISDPVSEDAVSVDGALEELEKFCARGVDSAKRGRKAGTANGATLLALDAPIGQEFVGGEDFPFGSSIFADDDVIHLQPPPSHRFQQLNLHGGGSDRYCEGATMMKLEEQKRRNWQISHLLSPIRKTNDKAGGLSVSSKLIKAAKAKRKFSLLMSSPSAHKKPSTKQYKMNNSVRKWREDVVPLIRHKLPGNLEREKLKK